MATAGRDLKPFNLKNYRSGRWLAPLALMAMSAIFLALPSPFMELVAKDSGRRSLVIPLTPQIMPTLIVMHGSGSDAESTANGSGFRTAAANNGMRVVFPNANGGQWHDLALGSRPDDVAYIVGLAERLIADGLTDPSRLYVAGISQGGILALAVACARPDLFAGVGTIIAEMTQRSSVACNLGKPMKLVMINGTADTVVPIGGGDVGLPGTIVRVIGAEETARRFADMNHCEGAASVRTSEDGMGNRAAQTILSWQTCRGQSKIELMEVQGGSHRVYGWSDPFRDFFGIRPDGFSAAETVVSELIAD